MTKTSLPAMCLAIMLAACGGVKHSTNDPVTGKAQPPQSATEVPRPHW